MGRCVYNWPCLEFVHLPVRALVGGDEDPSGTGPPGVRDKCLEKEGMKRALKSPIARGCFISADLRIPAMSPD